MSPSDLVEVFETFRAVANRLCPDADVADDLAMEEFDKYTTVRQPRLQGNRNLRAYAWKVLACKYRAHMKRQWRHITPERYSEDAAGSPDLIYPPSRANQENYVEARQWLPFIEELPEPCRSAIQILGGGGTVTDVMDDLQMAPKSALYAIAEGRRLLKNRVAL